MSVIIRHWYWFRCLACGWRGQRAPNARKCLKCRGTLERIGRAKLIVGEVEVKSGESLPPLPPLPPLRPFPPLGGF